MRRDRVLRYLAIAAGAVVLVAVGVAAFISLHSPLLPANSAPSTGACAPQPCANERGYVLWVSDLKVSSGLVSMQFTFRNSSAATHADPADIQLVDSQGHTDRAVHDSPGCGAWPRTDFNNGARFGPVPECFRPASTAPPMKLHWAPDFGIFCCELDIPLQIGS